MTDNIIKRQNIEALRLAIQIRKMEAENKADAWEPEYTQDVTTTDWPAEWGLARELAG